MELSNIDKEKEEKEKKEKKEKKNSITDFLFSNDNKNKLLNKSTSAPINQQINEHKKIPMFADTTNNINNNKKNTIHKLEFDPTNIKPYNVKNQEHQKMLMELKTLVDYYMNIISEEDQRKIYFLIDLLKNEL